MKPPYDDPFEEYRQQKIDAGECMSCDRPHLPHYPFCAHCCVPSDRRNVLKKVALLGIENQLRKLERSNHVDFRELQDDLKRAHRFIQDFT